MSILIIYVLFLRIYVMHIYLVTFMSAPRRSPWYLIIIFLVFSHYLSLLLGSQSIWYAYAYFIVHIQESQCRKGARTHMSNDGE
jgi:hypothetical protein